MSVCGVGAYSTQSPLRNSELTGLTCSTSCRTATSRLPSESSANGIRRGFWRVDANLEPELRLPVLAMVALNDLQSSPVDTDEWWSLVDKDRWMLPETIRLAEYGLGNNERARQPQAVASRFGPQGYNWQLAQSAEEWWRECEIHAAESRYWHAASGPASTCGEGQTSRRPRRRPNSQSCRSTAMTEPVLAGSPTPIAKTKSELLFEGYPRAHGYTNFDFEPEMPGTTKRPDYRLAAGGQNVLFEIKEFRGTPGDFSSRGGFFNPYPPLREKIEAGRKKFKDLRSALLLSGAPQRGQAVGPSGLGAVSRSDAGSISGSPSRSTCRADPHP